MRLLDLFSRHKISLRLTVPKGVRIEHQDGKVKFIATMYDISMLANEIRKVATLRNGQLAKIDKFIFKVSDVMTEDGFRSGWVELPAHAWNIMASKFLEVTDHREDNPFYFNSSGYTTKTSLDIGVEVTDLKES